MEGFKVLQARTGDEAIHVVQQNRSRLDVLITDIVMPKMSGRQVAEKLLDLNSDLKVLYMSGDTDEAHRTTCESILRRTQCCASLSGSIHLRIGSTSCSASRDLRINRRVSRPSSPDGRLRPSLL